MGVISPFDDNIVTEPPRKERRPIETWKAKRPLFFHKCRDTRELILPFTKAYYGETYIATERVTVTDPSIGKWITPDAYLIRKLKVGA